MHQTIKAIEISLENCELIRFNGGVLHHCDLGNKLTGNRGEKVLDEIHFTIDQSENRPEAYEDQWSEKGVLPFDRIAMSQDIVSISFLYDDDSKERLYVPWDDLSGQFLLNNWQSSYFDRKKGVLSVSISEKENQ